MLDLANKSRRASPRRSERRDEVFERGPRRDFRVGDWIDFYALLEVEESVGARVLEEAILARGVETVLGDLGRAGDERTRLARSLSADLRFVLLDPERRARYDAGLRAQRLGEARPSFQSWREAERSGALTPNDPDSDASASGVFRMPRRSWAQRWRERVRANLAAHRYL